MAMKCKWNCNATFCRDGKVLAQGIVLAGILLGGCYGSHDLGYEVFGMPKGLFVALINPPSNYAPKHTARFSPENMI